MCGIATLLSVEMIYAVAFLLLNCAWSFHKHETIGPTFLSLIFIKNILILASRFLFFCSRKRQKSI